jgi:hypothetical protein
MCPSSPKLLQRLRDLDPLWRAASPPRVPRRWYLGRMAVFADNFARLLPVDPAAECRVCSVLYDEGGCLSPDRDLLPRAAGCRRLRVDPARLNAQPTSGVILHFEPARVGAVAGSDYRHGLEAGGGHRWPEDRQQASCSPNDHVLPYRIVRIDGNGWLAGGLATAVVSMVAVGSTLSLSEGHPA